MKKIAVVLTVAVLVGCGSSHPASAHRVAPIAPTAQSTTCRPAVTGHADPRCTPGVSNPNVTQATIAKTICVRGWTATVRPPVSYTDGLKVMQLVRYSYADRAPRHYEEDHLIPLEVGGNPTDSRNLFPQPLAAAHVKDQEENALRAAVCTGRITLAAAQAKIVKDWT